MLFSILNDMKRLTFRKHKSGYYYYCSVKQHDYSEIDNYPTTPIPIKIIKIEVSYQFLKINGQWSKVHTISHLGGTQRIPCWAGLSYHRLLITWIGIRLILKLKTQRKYVVTRKILRRKSFQLKYNIQKTESLYHICIPQKSHGIRIGQSFLGTTLISHTFETLQISVCNHTQPNNILFHCHRANNYPDNKSYNHP